jgi:hypothetical protein
MPNHQSTRAPLNGKLRIPASSACLAQQKCPGCGVGEGRTNRPVIVEQARKPSTELEKLAMADKFDAYRESLIVETTTVWPDPLDSVQEAEKQRIADALHSDPEKAAHLEYVRTHTGFCRQITVTDQDLQRLR